jgi:multidrug transporter EmrE-like cation transporter
MMPYFVLLLGSIANIAAQVILKASANQLNTTADVSVGQRLIGLATNPLFLLAGVCYGIGFLLYFIALSKLDLNQAYPLSAIFIIVSVTLISGMVFSESLSPIRLAGIAVCCLGIVIVFTSK